MIWIRRKAVRNRRAATLVILGVVAVAVTPAVAALDAISSTSDSDNHSELQRSRETGDLPAARRHMWSIVAQVTADVGGGAQPLFESWYGEGAVFANSDPGSSRTGIRGFSRRGIAPRTASHANGDAAQLLDVPVLTYTLYNRAAFEHIRRYHLQHRSELNRLLENGPPDTSIMGNRSVPPFPPDAIVIKTAWMPVARDRPTAIPVWDAEANPARKAGNPFIGWPRVVAVDPNLHTRPLTTTTIDYAGKQFHNAARVGLGDFYHVAVDADLAGRLARDRSSAKVAVVTLGRLLTGGDYLVLVGLNIATKRLPDWTWGALWWHDRSEEGPFSADRPATLRGAWRNYLMQAALDAELPAASDGGPHICFNPWLEGRFPDGGRGGGTVSNCLTCHSRASYPATTFLPVTRGRPDTRGDVAYTEGRLRTNSIWSLALHGIR